jgi:hypothetical protein
VIEIAPDERRHERAAPKGIAMSLRERLAHELKVRFGLPPAAPSDDQLDLIIADVVALMRSTNRYATESEWRLITYQRVPFAGKYGYHGLTFQDLNALLAAIRVQAQTPTRR